MGGVPGLSERFARDPTEFEAALGDLAGGEWPERARKAAVGLSGRAQEGDPMAVPKRPMRSSTRTCATAINPTHHSPSWAFKNLELRRTLLKQTMV